MQGWGKGIVIVNGRSLGRYWPENGPTQTLYLPGVWLKRGKNQVRFYHHRYCSSLVKSG